MTTKGDVQFSAVFDIKGALDGIKNMSKGFMGLGQSVKKVKTDKFESNYKTFNKISEGISKYQKLLEKTSFESEKFYKISERIKKLQDLSQRNREKFDKKDPMSIKNVKDKTKETEKFGGAFEKVSAWTIAAGNLMSSSIMSGWGMLKQGLMDSIPAIGQTFGMIQQTIFRNMAMPIAQTILPLLQKLMHWVRDNRTAFVRFGVMILEVFKFVGGAIKSFFQLVKTGFDAFNKSIGGVTISFDKIMKFFQLVMFKASILIAYILILIEPVIEKLGQAFGNIYYKAIKPFISGLSDAFGERITSSITKFISLVDRVAGMFLKATGQLDGFEDSSYNLGYTIGTYLFDAIDGTISIVEDFLDMLSDPDGQIIFMTTAVAGLALAIKSVGFTTIIAKAKLIALNGVMSITNTIASMNPFVLIALAVIGVSLALWQLYKNWDKVTKFMEETFDVTNKWNNLKNIIINGWAEIKGRFDRWVDQVRLGWDEIKNKFLGFISEVKASWDELWTFASIKWDSTKETVIEGWEYIVGMFTFTIKKIKKFFKDLWDSAFGFFNDFAEKLKNSAVWNWIINKIAGLKSSISGLSNAMDEAGSGGRDKGKDKGGGGDNKPDIPKFSTYSDFDQLKREQYDFTEKFWKANAEFSDVSWWSSPGMRAKALSVWNNKIAGILPKNSDTGSLPMRAKGGYVSANTPYVVGEKGAELFTPNKSGYITPNDKIKPLLTAGRGGKSEGGNTYVDNRVVNIYATSDNPKEIANSVSREMNKKPNYAKDFFASQTKYGAMG